MLTVPLYPGQWTRGDRRQTWQRRDVDTICYEAWQILSSPVMSSVLIQWNASYITLYILVYLHTMLQWRHLSWATTRSRLMWGTFFCLKVQQKQHQMLRGYYNYLISSNHLMLSWWIRCEECHTFGRECRQGRREWQWGPGTADPRRNTQWGPLQTAQQALTFTLHISETSCSCLVSTNVGMMQ